MDELEKVVPEEGFPDGDAPLLAPPLEGLAGLTLENLLEALREFIEEDLKDFRLPVKQERWSEQPLERPAEVSVLLPPDASEEHERIPYILLQLLNGKDEPDGRGYMESLASVRIIITIYNHDRREGRLQLLYIIDRLRRDLIRQGVIGGSYELRWPLEYLIYPDDTEWNHLAEMLTTWAVPPVEMDVPELRGAWGAFEGGEN